MGRRDGARGLGQTFALPFSAAAFKRGILWLLNRRASPPTFKRREKFVISYAPDGFLKRVKSAKG